MQRARILATRYSSKETSCLHHFIASHYRARRLRLPQYALYQHRLAE